MFVTTKDVFCRNKSIRVIYVCREEHFCPDKYLSRQTGVCRDKSSVDTCLSRQNRDMFVAIKHVFCRDNVVFVAKKVFVVTNICRRVCRDNQTFTATKDVFCRNKHVFVARKKKKKKKDTSVSSRQ